MFSEPDHAAFLPLDDLPRLVETLMARGYECLGPAVENGAIMMRRLERPDALPRGLQTEQGRGTYRVTTDPQNRYFAWANGPEALRPLTFAPRESLWRVGRDTSGALRFDAVEPEPPLQAVFGVRACDLAALGIQDAHFLRHDRPDPQYARRRESLFLVAVQCAQPSDTCFCASTGDGPTPQGGYDLALVELADGFVVEAGTDKGAEILGALALGTAASAQLAAARAQGEASAASQTRRMASRNMRDILMTQLEHPRWDDVASRCLACANCTLVCPTCFCHAEFDEPALTGDGSGHVRIWDSCFVEAHGYLHGFNVRPDVRTRYRQWLTHKLGTWHDQFGRSGCVGCGRCIAWCPTGIDITEEAAVFAASAP